MTSASAWVAAVASVAATSWSGVSAQRATDRKWKSVFDAGGEEP